MTSRRILILGGTGDAGKISQRLQACPDLHTITSLAGRTSQPQLPLGEVRIGNFGGVDGLVTYMRQQAIAAVIDATHPYAVRMANNAFEACRLANIPLIRFERAAWIPQADDHWLEAGSTQESVSIACKIGQRIFITLGRQELAPFAACSDRWFLVRCIEPPELPLPLQHRVLSARGPFHVSDEIALIQKYGIDVLISKNSGGTATYPKIEAARACSIPVVMVRRPSRPQVPHVASYSELVDWLQA